MPANLNGSACNGNSHLILPNGACMLLCRHKPSFLSGNLIAEWDNPAVVRQPHRSYPYRYHRRSHRRSHNSYECLCKECDPSYHEHLEARIMGEAKANWEASVEKDARDTLRKDCIEKC